MQPQARRTEHQLIATFAKAIDAAGVRPPGVVVGVGDDAAVLRPESRRDTIVTNDVQVEGRHFERNWLSGRDLGWRLAAVNLSDIAAMGGEPRHALLSLVVPSTLEQSYVVDIVRGAVSHLSRYGAALVGGNVSSTEGPLVCDMTLMGVTARGKAWRRRGRARDAIVVAGETGAAAAGLLILMSHGNPNSGRPRLIRAFTRPEPRLDVAGLLAGEAAIHGAIDVSDGLSSDLIHMCRAGGVGCSLDGSAFPITPATLSFCRDHEHDPIDWAMRGGEDYALVLSVAPSKANAICGRIQAKLGVTARVVGRFTAARGTYHLRYPDGRSRRFKAGGFDHFT
jgi:thiamine-monophosphate kinase